ncbi:SulP family inorganic anion transporter [Marivita hallyeonensis]|uniref:Sulfate permease, SulP family n=1 Tax=Marivita hallyeonensis TaxID=996342 RepID=A0A1M5TV73_9RHOB|nr:sulfate permease [Marivita hallyeonensis]SHH54677.1 sulfate permease, SulP family [Marivita hallyeonensis]
MTRKRTLSTFLPILGWARQYSRQDAVDDSMAAVIVTIMLIPQSLAYALLAGLPPEMGLYASILPLVAYAIFGTSRSLAVGPVAVLSLMTAAAIGALGLTTPQDIALAAALLALMSGGMLLAMGLLRLGQVTNFLSHPVISGFITASGLLIAASQLRHLLGIDAHGHTLVETLHSLTQSLPDTHLPTVIVGGIALASLIWSRRSLKAALLKIGFKARAAELTAKAGPIVVVIGTTVAAWALDLGAQGVALVGSVPTGLPPIGLPSLDLGLIRDLWVPALMISVIGFVESASVAQTLARKRKQRIDPDQELLALGASNIASSISGGFPVTGGFARSVVNFDAGARTPAAGAFTAIGLAFAAFALTPLLFHLPKATLAATIIVAVLGLVDFGILKRAWGYSKVDFIAVAATLITTLAFGVEPGVLTGVAASIALHLYKTSRPHVAEVGRMPQSEHFRNVLRHEVETLPDTLMLRVDESLYFANARFLEDLIEERTAGDHPPRNLVLVMSAVNEVDMSALETLEDINTTLRSRSIDLHLCEVKGPVMDRLQKTHLIRDLTGQVFLSQWQAWRALGGSDTPRSA